MVLKEMTDNSKKFYFRFKILSNEMFFTFYQTYLPSIYFTDTWNGMCNHESQSPSIKVGRGPKTLTLFNISPQKIEVVIHFGDEIFTIH